MAFHPWESSKLRKIALSGSRAGMAPLAAGWTRSVVPLVEPRERGDVNKHLGTEVDTDLVDVDCTNHGAASPSAVECVTFSACAVVPSTEVEDIIAEEKRANVAVVMGTYQRRRFVQDAVLSVRRASGGFPCRIVVVDGGSTDGTRQWLAQQPDVQLIEQTGELTGAVAAFNLGFGWAVDMGYDYVANMNDDCILETPGCIGRAIELIETDASIGAVAFAFDLRGGWDCEYANGVPYVNFGVTRTVAGKQVAIAQGDALGRNWWNPIYRTYGADTEFGMWLHHLNWRVVCSRDWRVHDRAKETNGDPLRVLNNSDNPDRDDSKLFWRRWPSPSSVRLGPVG